ncbi:MAG: hypothetical protein LUG56_00280 [Lachnospiraceae bacterium]|nr:hypothetical protein [Lachnospiraceae bacterium]MCD7840889.1 hypothetical protein [Lachnospiraceae bacterium]
MLPGVCAVLALYGYVLSGFHIVSRVKYELTGSEETWEAAAAAEGYSSSVEEYYYDHLAEELHEAYREVYVHLMRYEDSGVFLSAISAEEFWQVYYAVLADHPEIFWTDTSAQVEESALTGTVMNYHFDVTVEPEERDAMRTELEAAADACISQIPSDATDYEKIKAVFEYVIDTTEYDVNSEDSQNIQSALLYHSSVCAGYSRAFQYILHRMGLFCTYITGTIVDGGDHGWNMVRIAETEMSGETLAGIPETEASECYYYVDVTWGDPVFAGNMDDYDTEDTINYNYLCCTETDLFRTHVPDGSVELPECTSDSYDYYKRNGFYYESFDWEVIYQALMESVQAGDTRIMMKFGSGEAYLEAQSALFEGNLLDDPGQYLMRQNGVNSWNYRYHTDDNFYLITVYWN